ncbi:MAG: hypothetical protein JW731_16165 [Bacteroidales bacterium]|nr:hypothetical protein [Bacteroidales bacterium]
MKSIIGIYISHVKAIEAIKILKGEKFPKEGISLIGKTHVHNEDNKSVCDTILSEGPMTAGVILAPVLGVLTGIGIFAIPGLGFLYGAGALEGAMAGLDLGLVGDGLVTLLTSLGISETHHLKFEDHLEKGKILLIARGERKNIEKAKVFYWLTISMNS